MRSNLRSLLKIATSLAAAVLLGTACGQGPASSAHTDASGLTIAFRSLSPPVKGDNRVEAVITQDGQPVADATVAATFRMPAMPSMNMPEMHTTMTLEHQDGGRYVGDGQLSMAGTWNVMVTVSRGDIELGSSRFTLQAE